MHRLALIPTGQIITIIFVQSLRHVGSTLASLNLHFPGKNTPFLADILSACPHVSTVRFTAYDNRQAFASNGLPDSTCLKTLVLETGMGGLMTSTIRDIMTCSPQLRHLGLQGCQVDIHEELQEHITRTRLKNLYIFSHGSKHWHDKRLDRILNDQEEDIYTNENNGTNMDASTKNLIPALGQLKILHVENIRSSATFFSALLHQLRDTLEDLLLGFLPSATAINTYVLAYNISMPNLLTSLSVNYWLQENIQDLVYLVKYNPRLTSLTLEKINSSIHADFFYEAAKLENLSNVKFNDIGWSNEDALIAFLSSTQQDNKRKLTSISMTMLSSRMSPTILDTFGTMENLTKLIFWDNKHSISITTKEGIRRFARTLGHTSSKLKEVDLLMNISFSEYDLRTIGASPSLKRVRLWGADYSNLAREQILNSFPPHIDTRVEYEQG